MVKTKIVGARHISEKSQIAGGPIFFWKVPDDLEVPAIPKQGLKPEAVAETARGLNRIAIFKTFNVDENEKIHDRRSGKILELEDLKPVVYFYEEEKKSE